LRDKSRKSVERIIKTNSTVEKVPVLLSLGITLYVRPLERQLRAGGAL
jgi:hypothetical protein